MTKRKESPSRPTNTEIRRSMLQYFYDRNRNATSARGKRGSAVRISDVKKELKASNGLTQQEIQSNLTYLISQGWGEEDTVEKSFTAPGGTVIPSSTSYYKVTAAGVDKIEGQGEFTMPKFHGIKIEATGQNIITLGDGNQINAVLAAALRRRQPTACLIFRSDRGAEFLAQPPRVFLAAHRVRHSANTAGPGDNAHMESFFH